MVYLEIWKDEWNVQHSWYYDYRPKEPISDDVIGIWIIKLKDK